VTVSDIQKATEAALIIPESVPSMPVA
jgi:hypothetical protein